MKKLKRLYVLRHGNAEPYGLGQDEFRKLTELGVAEVKATARAFLAKNEVPDVVLVSPYVRAQQTATHFLSVLEAGLEIQNSPLITPYGKEVEVTEWLDQLPYESILLITHQPFAYQLVDFLVDEPLPANFAMATATLAAVEGEFFAGACCRFRWCSSPE
jgi:phosphohistidine phosphatase